MIFAHHKSVLDELEDYLNEKNAEFIRIDGRTNGKGEKVLLLILIYFSRVRLLLSNYSTPQFLHFFHNCKFYHCTYKCTCTHTNTHDTQMNRTAPHGDSLPDFKQMSCGLAKHHSSWYLLYCTYCTVLCCTVLYCADRKSVV